MSYCTVNPITRKNSNLAGKLGMVRYSKISNKYYDVNNLELNLQFAIPNTLPVYNPAVLDENGDFKLFKRTKVQLNKKTSKYVYELLEGQELDNSLDSKGEIYKNKTDIVILPTPSISHHLSSEKPIVTQTKNINNERVVTRIESIGEDVGVSVNNLDENSENDLLPEEEIKLQNINNVLNKKYKSLKEAYLDIVFKHLTKEDKTKLLKTLRAESEMSILNSDRSVRELKNLNRTLVRTAAISNNVDLIKAVDKFLQKKKSAVGSNINFVFKSVKQKKIVDLFNHRNTEVIHNESIKVDLNGHKMTHPLTGQWLLNHEYHLYKDPNGNLLKEPQKVETSVTNEIDIYSPFNRFKRILDINLGNQRWQGYFPRFTLELLLSDEFNSEELISINPYTEFEGKNDRIDKFVNFETKPVIVKLMHAAMKNDQQEILNIILDFNRKAAEKNNKALTPLQLQNLVGGLLGKRFTETKDYEGQTDLSQIKQLREFPDSVNINLNQLKDVDETSYYFNKNVIYKFRELQFGTIAGTYVHGIVQSTMGAAMKYGTDVLDANGNVVDIEIDWDKMISENSQEGTQLHDFVEYAKEIKERKANSPEEFEKKLGSPYRGAINSIIHFRKLAKEKYAEVDENGQVKPGEPILFFENIALTRNYRSLLPYSKGTRNLASKIDVSVVFPNGKVIVIDVKSSTRNKIKASSITNPEATERYNLVEDEELKEGQKYPEKKSEGYSASDQNKHSKQLEIYRKILMDGGIAPEDIETYIFFVAVEEIDKSKPIDNSKMTRNIDNVFDAIGSTQVPNFRPTDPDSDYINKSNEYGAGPFDHLIPGDTLAGNAKNRKLVDRAIGKTSEEIYEERANLEFLKALEEKGTEEFNNSLDTFKKDYEAVRNQINDYLAKTERIVQTTRVLKDDEKKAKIKQLKELSFSLNEKTNDVVSNIVSIIKFIEVAHTELLGDMSPDFSKERELGLLDKMIDVMTNYSEKIGKRGYDDFELLNESISRSQYLFDIISQFKTLKDIMNLNNITNGMLFNEEQIKKLNAATAAYDRAMKLYDKNSVKMISQNLMMYHDSNLDRDYNKILNNKLNKAISAGEFTQQDLDSYKDEVQNQSNILALLKTNPAYQKIYAIYDSIHHLNVSAEEIESELIELRRDIGGFSVHVLGAGMQNNRVLQLVFKKFKTEVALGEQKTKEDHIKLDEAFQKYIEAVGRSNNMEKLYGHILEKKKQKRWNPETKKIEEHEVWQFLEEYDTDYMLQLDELVRQRNEARENNNKIRERELIEEIKNWELENLEKIYVDDYYEIDNILGPELKEAIKEIDDSIFEIKSNYPTNNPASYTNKDKEALKELYLKKKQLGSLYDGAKKKTGKALEMALQYQEYKKKRGEYVESELDIDSYNKAFQEAKIKYKDDPVMLQRWIDANSDIVLSDDFYDRHLLLSLQKNILVTLMNSKDPSTAKLAAKYNGLKRMISTNPNEFVEQMRKFIRDNNIEFYNNAGEEIMNALEMLKPYRDNRGVVNYSVLPEEVTIAVKNLLEKNSEDRFKEFKKTKGQSLPSSINNKSVYASEYRNVMTLKKEHESFVINSEYYDVLESHLAENDIDITDYDNYINNNFTNLSEADKNKIKDFIENNKWYKNNHYTDYKYVYKDDKFKTEDEEFTNMPSEEDIIYGLDTRSDSKYWVVKEVKPISVWTRMVPANQEYVKINQEKLRTIIGLSDKHSINDLKITLKSDQGADIKVPLSKLISILNSEDGINAINDLKQNTTSKNITNASNALSYADNAYLAVKGEHSVQVLDIVNAATNTIKTELDKNLNTLKSDPDQKSVQSAIDNIQRSIDLIDDYSIKIDDNGVETVKISRALFDVEAETLDYYQKRPNILYNKVTVKKRFLKEDSELEKIIDKKSFKKVTDENGNEKTVIDYDNLRPKPLDKWRNKRYDQMMADTSAKGEAIKEFYKSITDFYLKKQEQYPPHKRRGLVLPSRRKSVGELLANKEARGQKISQTKSKAKQLGKRARDIFRADQDDIEDEGINAVDPNEDYEFALQSSSNIEIFGAGFENNSITLPVLYTQQMDADDVSLDIISSMQHFSHASNKYEALEKTIDTVRAVNTAFEKREENNKVLERDNKDRALVKNLAKSLMANSPISFKGKNETSNIFKYFQIFIDQQYKGINNRPSYAGSIRIDKAVDKLMGLQSQASIGGINPLAALKGTVNAMQASMSVAIEAAAGEYFSAYTLKKVIGPRTQYDLYKDQVLEIKATAQGSTISVTKTGMLLDHYDALQGNFVDSMGDNVSSGAVLKLFKSSTWFFNQYFGEYLNSMTVLNSFLEEHKVMDDGSVTTWKDYSQRPEIVKLTDSQYKDARTKFRERPSLRSSIEVAPDGKRLINNKVKLPNGSLIEINDEWKLGGREDINLRLKVQAISRELNGAYAQADKTGMQQAWYGRALMMYKKYLVPSLKRRFSGTSYASQELGSVRTGYHYDNYSLVLEAGRNFLFNKQTEDLKELAKLYVSILTGGKVFGLSERFANGRVDSNGNLVEGKFTLSQVANIRKSLFEHMMLITMLLLLRFIDIGDDEDKEDISNARYIAIYLLDRLKREQNAMAINPFIGNPVKDNWKNLESPSAIIKTVKDLMELSALGFQHVSPFSDKEDLYYKNDYGIAEAGDSKFNIKFRKTVKVFDMWGGQTLETLIENMRRN